MPILVYKYLTDRNQLATPQCLKRNTSSKMQVKDISIFGHVNIGEKYKPSYVINII